MWIEQKVYTLKSEKGGDVKTEDILDNIFLRVNENLTTVTLKQLFLKNSEPEFKSNLLIVKGWSLLEKVIPVTGAYLATLTSKESEAKDQVRISFNNEILGNLELIEVENPLIQSNDKSIEDNDVEDFNKKIIELSQLKTADKETEEDVTPHTEASVPIENKEYENGKASYLKVGYKEFSNGNFKLLVKGEKVILFEIVSEEEIKVFSEPKILEENSYEFTDSENNEIIKVKVDGELLTIEKPEVEEKEEK